MRACVHVCARACVRARACVPFSAILSTTWVRATAFILSTCPYAITSPAKPSDPTKNRPRQASILLTVVPVDYDWELKKLPSGFSRDPMVALK